MKTSKERLHAFFLLYLPMKKKITYTILSIVLASCGSGKLTTSSVAYQSVRTRHAQPTQSSPIPDEAKIVVAYSISESGALTAIVYNRTSETMTIDQTMSLFINSNGQSIPYFAPAVGTTSTTSRQSVTKRRPANISATSKPIDRNGTAGKAHSSIDLRDTGMTGIATTNYTYMAYQPRVTIAPNSKGALSKAFKINGIGKNGLKAGEASSVSLNEGESYCRFSVCISYSLDNGETFDKITTNFYANSKLIVPVTQEGKVNEALRKIYQTKQDAINEYWWLLHFNSNIPTGYNDRVQGVLYDYK